MLRAAGGAVARGVSARAAAVHSRLLVASSSDSSAEWTTPAQAPAVSLRFASHHTASAGLCARRASPATALATRALSGAQHRVEGADVVPFNLADIGEGITGACSHAHCVGRSGPCNVARNLGVCAATTVPAAC